ncbi:MAG: hypothetical protein KDC98_25975 [Planctomycetes bacterium]|nr:hypothetical protein [Planctomycetota bacterium]
MVPEGGRTIRFKVADLADQLDAFAERWPGGRADARGRAFVSEDGMARLLPPLLVTTPLADERIGDYARRFGIEAGRHVVLLMRAAGVALGYWDGEELLRHKAIRKYVVRGSGKAQPVHLESKGKSRYGSRLRLQNWRRLLTETNERLRQWWIEPGEPERLFLSVPVRVFSDLLAADPAPPFARGDALLTRIPLHVHRPDHAELLRVHRWLAVGSVVLPPG